MTDNAPTPIVRGDFPVDDFAISGEARDTHWTNWGGNQSFDFESLSRPTSDDEVARLVREASQAGRGIRAVGSGHSFTPIVQSEHTLLSLDGVTGVTGVDATTLRANIRAGTRLSDIGAPLWDAGLSLANQGDIDAQSLAGAIATGTKGSGPSYGSLSSMTRTVRLVNGSGEIVEIAEADTELLRAAQVSIGMLGVFLELGIETLPAYKLAEFNEILPFDEVQKNWDHFLADYRHFSFWWMPTAQSSAMYDLGTVPQDHCMVKLLKQLPADAKDHAEPNRRTGRAHLIYPDATTEARFHELEYMVPADRGPEALDVIRTLMLRKHTDQISPVQIRWQQADEGYLSPHYQRNTMSVSVSGQVGTVYDPFLRELDRELQQFDARPHWGKIHYLTRDRVEALYPKYGEFRSIRKEFDPQGIFLNPHLRELFG